MRRIKPTFLAALLVFVSVSATAVTVVAPGPGAAHAATGSDGPHPQGVDAQGRPLQPGNLPYQPSAATADPGPMITRGEILARAESWLHPPVPYSQTAFRDGYRTDCSGYVSMAWRRSTSNWPSGRPGNGLQRRASCHVVRTAAAGASGARKLLCGLGLTKPGTRTGS